MMTDSPIRVRFAPSPTGALHIGGARTAYFNWLFARQQQGVFVLRIDDTDKARSTEASYEMILDSMRWLGMDWNEGPDVGGPYGPYRQSERLSIYREELASLIKQDLAYPCFCTAEELAADREANAKASLAPRYSGRCQHISKEEQERRIAAGESFAYRIRAPKEGVTVVHDMIRGDVAFSNEEIDDFIIWKADGLPTYHFASCVDDWKMGITHVIRAEEHLSNTPRHIVLFELLGASVPLFAHIPMILAPDRSKLSKRHGATSVQEYRDAGILPQGMMNYLLLLGFSPGDDHETLSKEEAISLFDLSRVTRHAAVYDEKKLQWVNAHHLRLQTPDSILAAIWPTLVTRGWVTGYENPERLAWLRTMTQFAQERSRTLNELVDSLRFYFESPTQYDEKGVKKHLTSPLVADRLRTMAQALANVQPFTAPAVGDLYHHLAQEWKVKTGELIHPTRLALTGITVGPGLFDLMALLGFEASERRMLAAADFAENLQKVSE